MGRPLGAREELGLAPRCPCLLGQAPHPQAHLPTPVPLTSLSLSPEGPFGPSLVRGLLAVSLAANALFTSAYLYQSLR